MKIYENVSQLVGKTPLVRLNKFGRDGVANIIAKLERSNPTGSVKDRAAKYMIEEAEKRGVLKEGSIIIEPTSGNTGIGISAIAAAKGYQVIIVMPDTMTVERQNLMKSYGAKVVLTPGALGMKGSIEKAKELNNQIENSWIAGQFDNRDNIKAHLEMTGPEIWEDSEGKVDILVSGVGSGGTITGIGEYLKSKNPSIKVVAIEPEESPVLSKGVAGVHKIPGISAGFVPSVLNTEIYDEILTVSSDDAWQATRDLAKEEGLLCGISSGAAAFGAKVLASREENRDKNIIVVLPDTGERYLSTGVFTEE